MSSPGRMALVCTANIYNSNGIWTGNNPLNSSVPLLTVQLVLVVITTRILYCLLKPLKQPRFVAEILGGIVLGPSVLGRSETFTSIVFPVRGKMVLETVAMMGLMYCVFLIGVKTDPILIKRSGKKEVWIGLTGVVVSMSITVGLELYLSDYLSKPLKNLSVQFFLGSVLSLTSFAVLVPYLWDLHLVNSELGRLSTSSALLSDFFGWLLMVVFIVLQASVSAPIKGLWALLSVIALVVFIFAVIRPMTIWVVEHTPEGKPVEDIYIFFILLAVSVVGFLSDMIGANSFNGALVLGLAIPDGPPLGAALVEKLESVVGLLLPLFYASSGLRTNVFAIKDLKAWGFFQLIVVAGCVGKVLGTMLPALYFKMPFTDSMTLSLMMCCKGLVEVITYNLWESLHILDQQSFAILIMSTILVVAVMSPFLTLFYQPSKRYVIHKRRTIQHSKPDTELRILACIHHQANVPTLINILEASHATQRSPLDIIALHLVQPVGRSVALMIEHKSMSRTNSTSRTGTTDSDRIVNAFRIFKEQHDGVVSVQPITTVVPYETMHIDVCTIALQKRVSLVIIPFHKHMLVDGQISLNNSIKTLNQNVLATAPCSVGVFVDRMNGASLCTLVGNFSYNLAILFFGGDDDREALAYIARMAKHPGVTVTVIRFIPTGSINDHSRERRLDIESLDDFKLKNMNNDRVIYRESMVNDTEEIVAMIGDIVSSNFDLLVVGMRHESNPLLAGGMTEWSEFPELGFVGDILASTDFASSVSVLVIQQQAHVSHYALNATDQNAGGTPHEEFLPQLDELVPSPHRMPGDRPTVRLRSPQL